MPRSVSGRRRGPALLPLAAACAMLGAVPAAAGAAGDANAEPPQRLILQPRAGLGDAGLQRLLRPHGGGMLRRIGRSELRIVELPRGVAARTVAERLRRSPHVEIAEVDRRVPPAATAVDDPYAGSQWHLGRIEAPQAWDRARGDGVRIAIVDTGVDGDHPDLASRLLPGWNFHDGNADTEDVHGHGTAVAGTAAAAMNDGKGVAGVAGRAQIVPVRVAAPDGQAYWSTIAQGIVWAADQGARVANVSYAVTGSASVRSAADYMRSKGGLVVVGAGNGGALEDTPATASMITVAATDSSDRRASWSSHGGFVTLSAPGAGIWTTSRGGGWGAASGTSFSSPVVAGAAALVFSARPELTPAEAEALLVSTAADLGAAGFDIEHGWGRVDAGAAVRAAIDADLQADTQAPRVAVTRPLGAATVSGWVPIDVTAIDDRGIARVELRVGGRTVATDTTAPFAFSWDSTQVTNGGVQITAVAVDTAGRTATSAPVAVTVGNAADAVAPSVRIDNPREGALVSGRLEIAVSASDDRGSAGLTQTLAINGRVVATASGGLLAYTWNLRRVPAGRYTIEAVARDAAGNTATRSVTVLR